jgi:hypothetical protein
MAASLERMEKHDEELDKKFKRIDAENSISFRLDYVSILLMSIVAVLYQSNKQVKTAQRFITFLHKLSKESIYFTR